MTHRHICTACALHAIARPSVRLSVAPVDRATDRRTGDSGLHNNAVAR